MKVKQKKVIVMLILTFDELRVWELYRRHVFSDDSDTEINQFVVLLCAAVLVKP